MNKLFISTGGLSGWTSSDAIKRLNSYQIFNIELSGGKFETNIDKKILQLNKKNNLRTHNYFLYPKINFVLNLASNNKSIVKKSINLIKKNILLAKKINSKYISFHAGFRFDPNFTRLGKPINKVPLISEKKALKNFLKNLNEINNFSKKKKIQILIENNVLSKKNYLNFKCNPFLLCSPYQIQNFFEKKQSNINLLLDVAHLKVSCKSLKFDLFQSYKKIYKYVRAYHLSDNNGISDSNSKVTKNSWFLKILNKKLDYYTLEVYTKNMKIIKNQINLIEKYING